MAVEIYSVQLLNRLLRFPVAHFYKAEAFRAAGLTVPHNAHEPHTAYPLEQAAELVLCSGGREIANMDPLCHHSPLSNHRSRQRQNDLVPLRRIHIGVDRIKYSGSIAQVLVTLCYLPVGFFTAKYF